MREMHQAIASITQRLSHMHSRARVEFHEVIVSTRNTARGGLGPDDTHRSDFGRRSSLAFGQFVQPLAHALMGNHPTSRIIGLSFGIKARLNRHIRF